MLIKVLLCIISVYYFAITTVNGWRPFRVEFTNTSTKTYVNHVQMNASISSSGSISIYVNALEDLPNMYAESVVYLKSPSGKYDVEIINKTIDACEFFENRSYEPILQVLYVALTRTGTFPKSCPIQKRLYFVKDVVINPDDLPLALPSTKAYLEVTNLSKYDNKMVKLGTCGVYAQIVNTA